VLFNVQPLDVLQQKKAGGFLHVAQSVELGGVVSMALKETGAPVVVISI
jgi:hypothetical protein